MKSSTFLNRLSQPAHPLIVFIAGAALLFGLHEVRRWIKAETLSLMSDWQMMRKGEEQMSETLNETIALRDLKARDFTKFKSDFPNLAKSKRSLYESGLFLQEQKRLLEKQMEIMSTYLKIDPNAKKISVMNGEQALQDFPYSYIPVQTFGGEAKPLPMSMKIVSKERFAHPERGKSEEINGNLAWTPPQVGTSTRSLALGEYVMFTNGPLILHGPPKKAQEHQAFPHLCLGLSQAAAMKLYKSSYIGTKILFSPVKTTQPLQK